MSTTMHSLDIDRLSIEEQLALVHEIWNSIAESGVRPSLSDAQLQELRRRVADDDARPDDTIPWEQVKADALQRLVK